MTFQTIVLGWLDRSLQHMVHAANYSACHYSPFSVSKLPDNLWTSDAVGATIESHPDPATPVTDSYVELGIEWLTTNSYRDAIVETIGDYYDADPETAGTDSYDIAVQDVTTNDSPVTEVEVTGAETFLDTASTPDHNSDTIVDGATTLS